MLLLTNHYEDVRVVRANRRAGGGILHNVGGKRITLVGLNANMTVQGYFLIMEVVPGFILYPPLED